MLRRRENMAVEKPLNVDEFFMSRNEIANQNLQCKLITRKRRNKCLTVL